ncbi:MAG: hypothetical protein HOW97_25140, partial [Catenulispora sp.]|nr:hypothetical protein [Catenulispora sp.]
GLAVAITGLLRRNLDPGPAAVREALSGVVCRCAEPGRWIEAVALAKEAEQAAGGDDAADPAAHPANTASAATVGAVPEAEAAAP